jgi:two-component sensor histidine kinase
MMHEINFSDLEELLQGGLFQYMEILDEDQLLKLIEEDYYCDEEAFMVSDNNVTPSSPTSI